MMRTEVLRPRCPVELWYWIAGVSLLNVIACVRLIGYAPAGVLDRAAADLAAEYPLLRLGVRVNTSGKNGISISGALSWNLAHVAVVVSQQSTRRFAGCRCTLLQAIA
jgi:hypothetical protein